MPRRRGNHRKRIHPDPEELGGISIADLTAEIYALIARVTHRPRTLTEEELNEKRATSRAKVRDGTHWEGPQPPSPGSYDGPRAAPKKRQEKRKPEY